MILYPLCNRHVHRGQMDGKHRDLDNGNRSGVCANAANQPVAARCMRLTSTNTLMDQINVWKGPGTPRNNYH